MADTDKDVIDGNVGTEIEGVPKESINNVEKEELFKSLFAEIGSREVISLNDWKYGWSAIVGGINGIPTSRQFNTLQYITDLKCWKLYRDVVELQLAGGIGIRIGTADELDHKRMILLEILKDTNKIIRVLENDADGNTHMYEFASLFTMAEKRERLRSGDTLSSLFGKIAKYLYDLKSNCFSEADNPFVLMTEATYKPPSQRTPGSLYGLITKTRGLIIVTFNRYVTGLEDPTVENTLYGVETSVASGLERDETPYVGILQNLVHIKEGQEIERQQYKLYAVTKNTR